jgi:hypothetical protein
MRGGKKGKITYEDGRIYDGEIQDGKANGRGIMTWSDDDYDYVYVGEWNDDKKNGSGKMTSWPKGTEHNDEWVEDMMIYDGMWVNDKRTGKGKYTWPSGDFYEGEWNNDNAHGYGIMKSSNGNIYNGQWRDGKKNGKGKMKYPNGHVYEGEWNDNKKINGTIHWSNGKEFRGLSNVQLSMTDATYDAKSRSGTPTRPHW